MVKLDTKTSITLLSGLAWCIFLIQSYLFGWLFTLSAIVVSLFVYHLGHSIFAHRHFSHNCYRFSKPVELFLNICFLMLNMGSSISYAGIHMAHHIHSGDEQDPHDYKQLGILRTFLGLWSTETWKIDTRTIRRFFKKPYAKFVHKHYFKFAVPFVILFAPISAMTVIWKSFSVITSHLDIGDTSLRRNNDTSNNCWWIKPILWGDDSHANHHRNGSADNLNFDRNWKQFDFLYYIAKGLERI